MQRPVQVQIAVWLLQLHSCVLLAEITTNDDDENGEGDVDESSVMLLLIEETLK
jgi:hypothetical protein